ncbi:hypothetical protein SASPL_137552 [Salvia splendens]|uniref:Uncharacterized protein n=1 Tax=Salvia splendens TaxID=180675 RepID=A0A8X8WRW6_SALSN|nr:hypothetical protein SASPL_137552 [Salvia splendens]
MNILPRKSVKCFTICRYAKPNMKRSDGAQTRAPHETSRIHHMDQDSRGLLATTIQPFRASQSPNEKVNQTSDPIAKGSPRTTITWSVSQWRNGLDRASVGGAPRNTLELMFIKPRSIRLHVRINGSSVSILIDGGSTHNFIQPTVAEKLSLPVNAISPFRVFAGDGASLKCAFTCLNTPVTLQGHQFEIDLFILQVKDPDIILGVQWQHDLDDITKNYWNLTMKFDWNNQPTEADIFELVLVQPDTSTSSPSFAEADPDLDAILSDFTSKLVAKGHASMHISVQDGTLHFKLALPPELLQGRPLDTPVRAVEERTVLVDGVSQVHCLVHWASDVNGAPSWESAAQLVKDFPHLRLEDKSFFIGGGVDRDPDKSLHESTDEDDEPERIEQPSEHNQPNTQIILNIKLLPAFSWFSDRTLKVWSFDGEVYSLKAKAAVAANDEDINSLAVLPRMEYKTKTLPYSPVCSASTILMVEGGDDIRVIGIGSNVCMPLPQQNICCLFANVESWHMESIRVGLVGHMGMLKRDNPDGLNLSAGYGACLS